MAYNALCIALTHPNTYTLTPKLKNKKTLSTPFVLLCSGHTLYHNDSLKSVCSIWKTVTVIIAMNGSFFFPPRLSELDLILYRKYLLLFVFLLCTLYSFRMHCIVWGRLHSNYTFFEVVCGCSVICTSSWHCIAWVLLFGVVLHAIEIDTHYTFFVNCLEIWYEEHHIVRQHKKSSFTKHKHTHTHSSLVLSRLSEFVICICVLLASLKTLHLRSLMIMVSNEYKLERKHFFVHPLFTFQLSYWVSIQTSGHTKTHT